MITSLYVTACANFPIARLLLIVKSGPIGARDCCMVLNPADDNQQARNRASNVPMYYAGSQTEWSLRTCEQGCIIIVVYFQLALLICMLLFLP